MSKALVHGAEVDELGPMPTSVHAWITERRTELGLAASSMQLRTAAGAHRNVKPG